MSAQTIREPVDPGLISQELDEQMLVREFRGVRIYVTTARQSPHTMEEIGRIRETEFRAEGGGTGRSVDIDEFDTGERPFRQLIAWDPENQEIIGMYRFLPGWELPTADGGGLPTARLFAFSSRFADEILPSAVELGRSVVNRSAKRAIMGLFAVWSGLGALVAEEPGLRYFFGKFTTFPDYHPEARSLLDAFLRTHCADPDRLVIPRKEFRVDAASDGGKPGFSGNYEADYQALQDSLKELGEMVPPLVISYLGLSRTMRCFGTARNPHFGDVFESAILIDVRDIGRKQYARFVDTYERVGSGWLDWTQTRAEPG